MILDKVKKQIFEAMKAKDSIRLDTLKMLSTALTNAEIAKKREKLTEEEELRVVNSEAKKRKEAIDAYKSVGNTEKAKKEEKELEILQEFLPKQLGEVDIEKEVDKAISETGAKSMSDMGKVMGVVMKELTGKADGQIVSKIVKEKLS